MNRQEKIDKIAKLDKGLAMLFDEILKGEDKRNEHARKTHEKHAILNTPVNED